MSNMSLHSVKLKLGMNLLDEKDLVWTEKRNSPYRYHSILEYKPTGVETFFVAGYEEFYLTRFYKSRGVSDRGASCGNIVVFSPTKLRGLL